MLHSILPLSGILREETPVPQSSIAQSFIENRYIVLIGSYKSRHVLKKICFPL